MTVPGSGDGTSSDEFREALTLTETTRLPPAGECIWCGSTDVNVEHVIGNQFLKKALGVDQPSVVFWGDIEIPLPGQSSEITLDERVCKTCNGGWMRTLDEKVAAFMRPSFKDWEQVDLNEKQQRYLAMWTTKVGVLLVVRMHDQIAANPKLAGQHVPYLPAGHLDGIRRTKDRPPKGTKVWISCIPTDQKMPVVAQSAGTILFPGVVGDGTFTAQLVPRGYFSLVAVGPLIVYISATDPYARPKISYPNELDAEEAATVKLFRRIWPIKERTVHWPTAIRFGVDEWEHFGRDAARWRDTVNYPLLSINRSS